MLAMHSSHRTWAPRYYAFSTDDANVCLALSLQPSICGMRRVYQQAVGALCRTAESTALQHACADSGSQACRAVGVPWQQQSALSWQRRFQHSSSEEQIPGLEQQARQVQESVAQRAMQDPLSALMTAAGVPLGIHLRVQQPGSPDSNLEQQQQWQDQQAAAAAVEQQAVPAKEGDVEEQLPQLMQQQGDRDTWGTTSESASSIAQRIAASNAAAAAAELHGSGLQGEEGEEGEDVHEQLAAAGMRYLNEATLHQDVEHMEEIYQLLAQVPYLDDSVTQERELRGVIAVALLGTLEEVGWALRPALAALWSGERDLAVLTGQPSESLEDSAGDASPAVEDEGTAGSSSSRRTGEQQLPRVDKESREYVALESILYHIQRLEADYGPPAAEGVEAAIAAVNNSGPPRDVSWWGQQERKQQQEQGAAAEQQHSKRRGS